MFKFDHYQPKYKSDILLLMASFQYKDIIWNWQFQENPYDLPFEPIIVKHGDKIVGFNGTMKVEIFYEGNIKEATWSCDFYVHSDYRGKGLGKIIKDKQFNSNSIVMSFGLSESAVYVWQKNGCKPNEDISLFRKHRKIDSFKKIIFVFLQATEYVKGFRSRVYDSTCQYSITDELAKKEDVDDLWQRVGNSYQKIVVRNYNYLHWRYENHPLASYKFIHISRNGELAAIGVFRRGKNSTKLVDMVAHSMDTGARSVLVASWLKFHSDSNTYNCVTSDKLLQKVLFTHGFYKTLEEPWCFVHAKLQGDIAPEKNWFIMSGDSDGEFLEASATNFELDNGKVEIIIKEFNDSISFRGMRKEWSDLLEDSNANKLFLSWEWQYTWWQIWADALNLKLILLKAYQGDKLIGIAPLYVDNLKLRSGIKIRRLQFIGNAWRRQGTVRTEYLEFITSNNQSIAVCDAFIKYISEKKCWNEFVICDLKRNTDTHKQIKKSKKMHNWFVDVVADEQGMNIGVIGNFKDYVKILGRNTRLKLFNRRGYLNSLGDVEYTSASNDDIDKYLSILNSFHQKRWGKDCFSGKSLNFHKILLNRLNNEQSYNLNCIYIDGKPISILYNLQMGCTVYNIQSGFNETFDKKLSLGTLHMGYAIEEAYINQRVVNFDMLAGKGKSEFYKRKYKGVVIDFITLRVTTSKKLKMWYIIDSILLNKLKYVASRVLINFKK